MMASFARQQIEKHLDAMELRSDGKGPAELRRHVNAELRSLDREIQRLRGFFEPPPVAGGEPKTRKPKGAGGEFTNPPKTPLERVATMLTEKGVQIKDEGSGGKPELTSQDFAAMLAGISHQDTGLIRTADALFWLGLVGDQRRRPDLYQQLQSWGCARFMLRFPDVTLSGQHHGQIVSAVIDKVAEGQHRTARELQAACKIGSKRWPDLAPHVAALIGRCHDAESLLTDHLRRQLAPCTQGVHEVGNSGTG
jgi:hypothetical protein